MKTIKPPAIFLAQFLDDKAPFNTFESIVKWASEKGFKAVQLPSWDKRCIDLEKAASSKAYCDELKGIAQSYGVALTDLSTHLQGQLIACHPAYNAMFDVFAPSHLQNKPAERAQWAKEQLLLACKASKNFNFTSHATFSGAFLWHTVYPWPQRPQGLVETGFKELANRWLPILNAFDEIGCDVCYELHPGEDLHDGVTFERFLKATNNHPRANILYDPSHFILQQLDYLSFIDIYHERIKAFHVKDAEFIPNGKAGVYGSYSDWAERPGRFRSLGDGQIDFKSIFTKFTHYGFDNYPVLEWECCFKDSEQGALEGAKFIQKNIITAATKTFDDFAGGKTDEKSNRDILGI